MSGVAQVAAFDLRANLATATVHGMDINVGRTGSHGRKKFIEFPSRYSLSYRADHVRCTDRSGYGSFSRTSLRSRRTIA